MTEIETQCIQLSNLDTSSLDIASSISTAFNV